MLAEILKSRFVQFVGFVVLVILLFFLSQRLYRKYEINKEVAGLKGQIASLESKNQDILRVINYFKTSEYKERQARSLLGLQKPGEFAVALPGEEGEEIAGAASEQAQSEPRSNFAKWWNYFFAADDKP